MTRCCKGTTYTRALGLDDEGDLAAWEVLCDSCHRVLGVVEAPRDEVYAHM